MSETGTSEFRTAARQTAASIMSVVVPSLARSIVGTREQRAVRMERSSDDLTNTVQGVRDTVEEINYNLTDVNDSMKKAVTAVRNMVVAVEKQNVSLTSGFSAIGGAVTALLAAAGLSALMSSGDDKKPVEPQSSVAPPVDGRTALKPLSTEEKPLEDLITPAAAVQTESFQTPESQQTPQQDMTRMSAEPVTVQPAAQTGFIIPGAASVTPNSGATPMTTTPSSITKAADSDRSMVEIRNSVGSQLPKDLELNADSIVFSAGTITMRDRSRENRVSREIQALREKASESVGAGQESEEQQTVGLVEPSMGLTTPYGPGAGGAGGVGRTPDALKTGENGRLRDDQLAPIGIGNMMAHPKAAEAFKAMRAAAAAEGVNLGVTGAYRTYERQVQLKAEKGHMAATPGRSNHGWGLAFDMDFGSNMNSAGFQWMAKNAARFGIHGPLQSPFEPWHWEYRGGEDAQAMSVAQQQQSGAPSGMGEGAAPSFGSPVSQMMPGMTGAHMMLPQSAGGGSPASMMQPSIGTGLTLSRQSTAPSMNSAKRPVPFQSGNPSPTSNPIVDSTSNNPRISDPATVGSISPEFDRFMKVFSGWGATLLSAAGR